MTARRLVFVPHAPDAPPPDPATRVVVLDTTWTPGRDAAPATSGIRSAAAAVLPRIDVFEEALDRLDRWAADARLVDGLTVDGTAWWYRAREPMWHRLHELLLWRHMLSWLVGDDRIEAWTLPVEEWALGAVVASLAGAGAGTVTLTGAAALGTESAPGPTVAASRSRGGVGRLLGRISRRAGTASGEGEHAAIERLLTERVDALAHGAPGRLLVLTHTGIHSPVGAGPGARLADPLLGPVVERLADAGQEPIVVGLGVDHRSPDHAAQIAADPRLLPQSLLQLRWRDPAEPRALPAAVDEAIAVAGATPLEVDGVDLAPVLAPELAALAATTILAGVRQRHRIARLLGELRPSGILLTHEGVRTPWLVAAARAGVPTFAVQHGVIYPTHPGYRHPRDERWPLPTVTFVTGPAERDVLLAHGGYRPDEVEVVGSPRAGASMPPDVRDPAERAAIRDRLGVAPGDRLLVVSTVFLDVVRRFHVTHMLERLLGGPLPGVHVVFKLHPGETDAFGYESLVAGLAAAGGYPPPAMTTVREIDLYAMLRAADAHLGLHSTVLSDAVATGTLNLIALTEAHADLLGYVAAGVARPVRDVADLRAALGEHAPPAHGARRRFLEDHAAPGDASQLVARRISGVAGVAGAPA